MSPVRGADVVIRQLQPSDADLVRAAFRVLSVDTRYLRYGLPLRDPSRALSWVAELGGTRNVAIGAVCLATGALLGGARYQTACDGTYAEVAGVVIDGWQGRGIGSCLLAALVEHAQRVDAAQLRASVLPGNRRARRLLQSAGGWQLQARRGGLSEYRLATAQPGMRS